MKKAFELFEGIESSLFKTLQKAKKINERAELVKFFVDNLKNKTGQPFPARQIAVKLSHLNKDELENFKGECKDVLRRRGQTAFQKYFWWSIKVK